MAVRMGAGDGFRGFTAPASLKARCQSWTE